MKKWVALALLVFATACSDPPAKEPDLPAPHGSVSFTGDGDYTVCAEVWWDGKDDPVFRLLNIEYASRVSLGHIRFSEVYRLKGEVNEVCSTIHNLYGTAVVDVQDMPKGAHLIGLMVKSISDNPLILREARKRALKRQDDCARACKANPVFVDKGRCVNACV